MFHQQGLRRILDLDCPGKPERYEAISTIIKIAKPVMSNLEKETVTVTALKPIKVEKFLHVHKFQFERQPQHQHTKG